MRLFRIGRIALVTLASLSNIGTLRAQQQSVVMVHGGNSAADTWSDMVYSLQSSGMFSPHAYDLQPATPIGSQALSLMTSMTSDQIPADAILLAHSQGGLVSRQATQWGQQMKGIVTIGTPHYGMGIGDHFGWMNAYFYYGLADTFVIIANNSIWYPDMSYDESLTREMAVDDAFLFEFVVLQAFTVALDNALGKYNASASWSELSPNSAFLNSLNQNSSGELARYRVGISSQLTIGSYGAGPLALTTGTPADAEQLSSFVESLGFDLLWRSSDIWYYMMQYGQDNPNRDYWGDYLATLAMDDLAFRLIDLGGFWVDVVGGYPHDGVVPTGSMAFPGGSNGYALVGVSHTQETHSVGSGQVMLGILNSLRSSP